MPTALLRAPPRRQQGQPARRRQRAGAARRGQPGALRRALPRRVPALPHRRHRGAAPAARERRGHDRPPRRVGDAAGPRHGGAGLQPVPLRRLPRPRPGRTAAPAARSQRRDYRRKVTGPVADRIDIVRHVSPLSAYERGDRFAEPRVLGRGPRRGSSWPAPPGRAVRRGQLAPQRPRARAGAARAVAARPTAAQRLLDDAALRRQLSRRGAVRVHRLAWTVADLRPGPRGARAARRGRRGAARCAPASRCCSRTLEGGPGERDRDRASGWPGSPWRDSPSRATRGSPRWSQELGAAGGPRTWLGPSATRRPATDAGLRLAAARPRAGPRPGRAARASAS